MAVAKSNAYGHGLVPYAELLIKLGAEWLGVDSIVEAVRLREASIAIKAMADAIEQAAWDAENQFHDVKVALGLE